MMGESSGRRMSEREDVEAWGSGHTHGGTDAPECTSCRPSKREQDVEALAEVLRWSPGWPDSLPEAQRPRASARYILSSSWLATHDEQVRAEALAPVRALAEDPEVVRRAAEAMEDAAVAHLGRDLGTVHRDEIAQAALRAALPPERLAEEVGAE